MESFGDFLAGFSFSSLLEYLALAVGERVGAAVPGFGGEVGIDDAESAMDATDCFGELGGGAIFEEIAFGSGIECAAQIAGAREGGEDDDARLRIAIADLGGEDESGHAWHFDVGDEDIGIELRDCVERLAAIGGAGADGDVGLGFKEGGEGSEHHGLIFGYDYLNFFGHKILFRGLAHVGRNCRSLHSAALRSG